MLTKQKIKIFAQYKGDLDMWSRSISKKDRDIMHDDDWYLIDSLIQDLFLIKQGVTSIDFNKNTDTKIKESCDNIETIKQLKFTAEYMYAGK